MVRTRDIAAKVGYMLSLRDFTVIVQSYIAANCRTGDARNFESILNDTIHHGGGLDVDQRRIKPRGLPNNRSILYVWDERSSKAVLLYITFVWQSYMRQVGIVRTACVEQSVIQIVYAVICLDDVFRVHQQPASVVAPDMHDWFLVTWDNYWQETKFSMA